MAVRIPKIFKFYGFLMCNKCSHANGFILFVLSYTEKNKKL